MVSALDSGTTGLGSSPGTPPGENSALAGDSVLCSWVGHLTLTVPPQVCKWVPAIC